MARTGDRRPPPGWRGRETAVGNQYLEQAEAKLVRAREILALLEDEPARQVRKDPKRQRKQGEA